MITKLYKTLSLLLLLQSQILFATETDSISHKSTTNYYAPKVHGVMRGRFEQQTSGNKSGRFQVANARVSLSGNVSPFASYFLHADFCDKGQVRALDAYCSLKPSNGLKIMVGQMRIPFSVDASRKIEDYLFTNHSFVGSYIGNYRGVGAKLGWTARRCPLYIEGGMFNSVAMTNHDVWQKQYTYAVKSRYNFGEWFVEGGFESRYPDGVRINMTDCALSWQTDRWTVEGEYVYKHYTNHAADACHAYNLMLDYRMSITTDMFNQLSFQGRFDGATDHSTGLKLDNKLTVNQSARKRFTAGVTISHLGDKIGCDIRANYEQYFYSGKIIPQEGSGNRLSVEMIVWF